MESTVSTTNAQVAFLRSNCMIEVETQPTDSGQIRYVARMSVVEEDGSIVRPLVGKDGRRIKILATSERLAVKVAVSYLEGRFGRSVPTDSAPSLGAATVGVPYIAP